jgi:hypothetical protein
MARRLNTTLPPRPANQCPASLHKRIQRIRNIAYDTGRGTTMAKVAERYAREGDCAMARRTLRAAISQIRPHRSR